VDVDGAMPPYGGGLGAVRASGSKVNNR